ncbi:hypothetical protein LOAG_12092 [Loa loa]|uniref:CCHC-type domain-containing protein n=1 Tax=Loa loa TaxID=7209 RepID=A0A1S0TLX4_LOALO|nr:hypothetical protein LOAG_12092 [Loa loa]EFO16415.1 hypothetical protein LOAG_12092 [Loa loa]
MPDCTICSQQSGEIKLQDLENQTTKSCCFCGAYMEMKQRCFTNSNETSTRCSTMSRLNATHLQPFTYTSTNNFRPISTISVNSSSTIHSSCKNSNTPSNADSQLSSRSTSPADGAKRNQESTESKKLCDKKTIEVEKKQTVIDNNLTTVADAIRWRMKQTKEFEGMNTSQDFQSSNRNDAQRPSLSLSFEKSAGSVQTTSFTVPYYVNTFIIIIQYHSEKKNAPLLCFDVNSQARNNTGSITFGKTFCEAQDQNMPESCWICGKVGHLTRYCQSTPPTVLLLAQEMKKTQQKKAVEKPRDNKGRVLYTSDESSDDGLDSGSDSDGDLKQAVENNSCLDHDIKLLSDDDGKDEFSITLKYKPYFAHINVEFGHKYAVSRSDEDIACSLWPLFFVQIQSDEYQKILEAHLDSLVANTPLANTEIVIGTLCVAYCERFNAKFRAVITAICSNLVEIFYIDYGNYEWVGHSTLWSIADQDKTTIIHPGMAIPCILNAYDQEKIASRLSRNDVVKMKLAVGCGQWGFYLNFRKRRPDGVCVVELEEGAEMD